MFKQQYWSLWILRLLSYRASGFGDYVEGYMILATIDCNVEATGRIEGWLRKLAFSCGALKVYTARSLDEAEARGLILYKEEPRTIPGAIGGFKIPW
ncbi:MAG: hypothetical protein ACO2OZ_08900 [Acidilobaceae archaeon]